MIELSFGIQLAIVVLVELNWKKYNNNKKNKLRFCCAFENWTK